MKIGSRIRNLRKDKNLSQVELGKMTGLSSGQISEYENDVVKPTIERLSRIADALSVSVSVLDPDLSKITGSVVQHVSNRDGIVTQINASGDLSSVLEEVISRVMSSDISAEDKVKVYNIIMEVKGK